MIRRLKIRHLRRKPLVIELPFGGGWLQPLRDAAEKLRRAARKEARKPKK